MKKLLAKQPIRSSLSVLSALVIFSLPLGGRAFAASALYVDKNNSACSDTGQGTQTVPFCSIVKAGTVATAGQTVFVSPGTYTGQVKITHSGTSGAPIVFVGGSGVVVTNPVSGGYGFFVSGQSYVTISNFTVTNTGSYGIYVSGGGNVTVSGNTVTNAGVPMAVVAAGIRYSTVTGGTVSNNLTNNNTDAGIFLGSGTSGVTVSGNQSWLNQRVGIVAGQTRATPGIDVRGAGNSIVRNYTHDNEDSGIQIYTGADNSLVADNITWNNGDHGIDDLNVVNGRIINNTVYHNCTSGINVEGTSTGYIVENNIAVDNAVYPAYMGISCSRRTGDIGIYDSAVGTTTVDHNLVYLSTTGNLYAWGSTYKTLAAFQTASGQGAHDVAGNPLWVSPNSGDFHLGAGSPAISLASTTVSGYQPVDYYGRAWVTPDAGAVAH